MSNINTGGPAFPPSNPGYAHGMTLRDYFAAHALQGGMANNRPAADTAGWAKWAYQVADAMLAAREKGGAA